ncbi:amino acid permease, partial [Paraburkholderia sp. SIMBA_049]
MAAMHVPYAAGVINFVLLIAALSAMNSQLYITTRMMFSLSRASHAPKALGEVNARGVPYGGILVTVAVNAIGVPLNYIVPAQAFEIVL